MIRRLFVYCVPLCFALLVWTQVVEAQDRLPKKVLDAVASRMMSEAVATVPGRDHKMMMQSPGCSGYSFGKLGYQLLLPSDEAAQGYVTGTMTVQPDVKDVNGKQLGVPSHKFTGTVGTKVIYTTASNHGSTAQITAVDSHGNRNTWSTSLASTWTSTLDNGALNNPITYTFAVTDANGKTSQDHITIDAVSGTAGTIVSQDAVPTNFYVRTNPNFGGGAMAQTCQICIQQPSACAGAQHTPYLTASITNNTSGEVKSVPRQVAGSIVDENSPISGSLFIPDISVVPGDDLSGSATGEIFCSAVADDIYNSLLSWRIEYGKVVVKDLGHPARYNAADKSYLYDVAALCDNNSDPSDWQPTVVHSWSGRHTYWWGVTSLFRAPDLSGVTWLPLANIMIDWTAPGPWGGILNLAKMVVEGGSIPYPGGTGPDFPIPGACTQYPKNVILTIGSGDLPWWPFNN